MTDELSLNVLERPALTMSSREIAELVEARHDNVKRTIERLAEKGIFKLPPLEEVKNHLGQTITEYRLIKRDSFVAVAQLCPEFTARVVDRWQELEQQVGANVYYLIPKSLPEALRLAADLAEKVEEQKAQIEVLAPKAEFCDTVAMAINSQTMEEVAKEFGTGRNRFFEWARANGILKDDNLPYQPMIDAGYLKTILKSRKNPKTGEILTYRQTLVTGIGVSYLHKRYFGVKKAGARL